MVVFSKLPAGYSRYTTKLGIFFGEAADKNLGDSEVGKGEGEG
jgi:hypothetical protein